MSSGIFVDNWSDNAIFESKKSEQQGPVDGSISSGKYNDEPHNLFGKRAIMMWYRSLSKTIPLSHSLLISFMHCHALRKAVLPIDILKWIM